MNMPLYSIDYIVNETSTATFQYFYTTRAARNFLWNNRNKIHDVMISLFGSNTPLLICDLRD
jgi:RNA-splicing ligase RtcB